MESVTLAHILPSPAVALVSGMRVVSRPVLNWAFSQIVKFNYRHTINANGTVAQTEAVAFRITRDVNYVVLSKIKLLQCNNKWRKHVD